MKKKPIIWGSALLLFAFLIRIIYPNLFISEDDGAWHILASMKLHQASLFEVKAIFNNFFAQLIKFDHGYTTIFFPYLFYEFFFGLLNFPIKESALVFINNGIGLLSLLSILYFLKLNFGNKLAFIATLLISVTPIHIGLSRIHVGTQIIQSIFFFLSLSFLHQFLSYKKKRYYLLYCLSTFFYIGADNLFILGLIFQVIYVYLLSDKLKWLVFKNIFFNSLTLLFIIFPITIYFSATFLLWHFKGIELEYLLRIFNKTANSMFHWHFIEVLKRSIELIGPIIILSVLNIFFLRHKILKNSKLLFLTILLLTYFLLLSISTNVESNYIFFLLIPTTVLGTYNLTEKPIILVIIVILTFVYSMSVVYNFNIGIKTTKNLGSINYDVNNNDYGIKTLGYLIRKGFISVGSEKQDKYGVTLERLKLLIANKGAFYYLGSCYYYTDFNSMNKIIALGQENYLLAIPGDINKDNEELLIKYFKPIGKIISDDDKILLYLYTTKASLKLDTEYYTSEYNALFDKEFGNIKALSEGCIGFQPIN